MSLRETTCYKTTRYMRHTASHLVITNEPIRLDQIRSGQIRLDRLDVDKLKDIIVDNLI